MFLVPDHRGKGRGGGELEHHTTVGGIAAEHLVGAVQHGPRRDVAPLNRQSPDLDARNVQ